MTDFALYIVIDIVYRITGYSKTVIGRFLTKNAFLQYPLTKRISSWILHINNKKERKERKKKVMMNIFWQVKTEIQQTNINVWQDNWSIIIYAMIFIKMLQRGNSNMGGIRKLFSKLVFFLKQCYENVWPVCPVNTKHICFDF